MKKGLQMNNNTKYKEYLHSDKWKQIAAERMKIDEYQCQLCKGNGTPNNPLEVHHLSYKNLYQEEDRIYEDLVTLCHTCHKGMHNVMNRKTNKYGRRGWSDNQTIPTIHTFTFSGSEVESVEVLKND